MKVRHVAAILAVHVLGCSSDGVLVLPSGQVVGESGATSSGATGGGSTAGGGGSGVADTGGSSAGGMIGIGGGATGLGGGAALGGAATVPASGGAAPAGGAPAGGAAPTGGTAPTGGVPSTGGTPSAGGMAPTGGAPSTGGVAPSGGASSTGGGPSSDPFEEAKQACVDRINAFRATEGKAPYERWTDGEACADEQAQLDGESNSAHGNFGMCDENAQNTCLWRDSIDSIVQNCLQSMWDEGPGEPFSEHGHYINMSSTDYTMVACGFYQADDGRIWASQNFR